ncbi:MAG: 2-phosphosulfolactate phosphatase [Ginsengibacter sp.]
MKNNTPSLYTVLSPAVLKYYDISSSIVVIIDVLRATSTIATALYNGAKEIIPVDSVAECIRLGKQMDVITAGERDGQIAEGLQYGNTPFQYTPEFIKGKTLVLTTTNGTKLLHMALAANANGIITGSFCNISAVCDYLTAQNKNVILACAAWKNKINIEDSLFAGAVINRIKNNFQINCDASVIAENLFLQANGNLFDFMKNTNASHYQRLMGFGLEEDIRFCLTMDNANVLSLYQNGRLIAG